MEEISWKAQITRPTNGREVKVLELRTIVSENGPRSLIKALSGSGPKKRVKAEVIEKWLHLDPGPAEFFMTQPDIAIHASGDPFMCVVKLTEVSVTQTRSTNDFKRALQTLERIFKELVKEALSKEPKDNVECQLYVAISLDQTPLGETSPLLESTCWVKKGE